MNSAHSIVAFSLNSHAIAKAVVQHCMGDRGTPLVEEFVASVIEETKRAVAADALKRTVPTRDIVEDAIREARSGEFDEAALTVDVIKRRRLLAGRGLSLFLGVIEDSAVGAGAGDGTVSQHLDEIALQNEVQEILDANGQPDEGVEDDEPEEPAPIETRLFIALTNVLADHRYGFCALRAEDAKSIEELLAEARSTNG